MDKKLAPLLDPRGHQERPTVPLAPRGGIENLRRGKILFYDNTKLGFCNYGEVFVRIRERLRGLGISNFVDYRNRPRQGHRELEAYAAMLAREKPAAAIVALGDIGTPPDISSPSLEAGHPERLHHRPGGDGRGSRPTAPGTLPVQDRYLPASTGKRCVPGGPQVGLHHGIARGDARQVTGRPHRFQDGPTPPRQTTSHHRRIESGEVYERLPHGRNHGVPTGNTWGQPAGHSRPRRASKDVFLLPFAPEAPVARSDPRAGRHCRDVAIAAVMAGADRRRCRSWWPRSGRWPTPACSGDVPPRGTWSWSVADLRESGSRAGGAWAPGIRQRHHRAGGQPRHLNVCRVPGVCDLDCLASQAESPTASPSLLASGR